MYRHINSIAKSRFFSPTRKSVPYHAPEVHYLRSGSGAARPRPLIWLSFFSAAARADRTCPVPRPVDRVSAAGPAPGNKSEVQCQRIRRARSRRVMAVADPRTEDGGWRFWALNDCLCSESANRINRLRKLKATEFQPRQRWKGAKFAIHNNDCQFKMYCW